MLLVVQRLRLRTKLIEKLAENRLVGGGDGLQSLEERSDQPFACKEFDPEFFELVVSGDGRKFSFSLLPQLRDIRLHGGLD
jgi:hypothetical protein